MSIPYEPRGTNTPPDVIRRVGVNLVHREDLVRHAAELPVGWYKNFHLHGPPVLAAEREIEHVPILLYQGKVDNPPGHQLVRELWDSGRLGRQPGVTLEDMLDSVSLSRLEARMRSGWEKPPYTLFLLGIEPGLRGCGDDRTPAEIVSDAVALKRMLDRIGRGYRLGLGGMSTARHEFVRQSYGVPAIDFFRAILDRASAEGFQFDAFTIHPYPSVLTRPVVEDSWDQIVEFRQVLADYGLRERELLVGEIGAPGTGADPHAIQRFAQEMIQAMLTATDARTGNPGDGHRLVQRFCWFCLSAPRFSVPGQTDNPLFDFPLTTLVDGRGALTALGEVFVEVVERLRSRAKGHMGNPGG
jgi:hypothetical protein